MTQPISKKDVWLALFSLDSYHRGYGQQIYTKARSETHLGNAILEKDINYGASLLNTPIKLRCQFTKYTN